MFEFGNLFLSFNLVFDTTICVFYFYQTGFLGLWGEKVDAVDYHISAIEKLSKEVSSFLQCLLYYFDTCQFFNQ